MNDITTAEVFEFIDEHKDLTDSQFLNAFEEAFDLGLSLLECSRLISWRR